MEASFIDRNNTNERILQKATHAFYSERTGTCTKTVELASHTYKQMRAKQLTQLLRETNDDPLKCITLQPDLSRTSAGRRRIGRPRSKWYDEAMADYWKRIGSRLNEDYRNVELNLHLQEHRDMIHTAVTNLFI